MDEEIKRPKIVRDKSSDWRYKGATKHMTYLSPRSHLIDISYPPPRYTLKLTTSGLRISPVRDQQHSSRFCDPYHLGRDPPGNIVVRELEEHHRFHADVKCVVCERQTCRISAFKVHKWICFFRLKYLVFLNVHSE